MAKFYTNCSGIGMMNFSEVSGEMPKNLIIDDNGYPIGFFTIGIAIRLANLYPDQKILLHRSDEEIEGLTGITFGSDKDFDFFKLPGQETYEKIIFDENNEIWRKLGYESIS